MQAIFDGLDEISTLAKSLDERSTDVLVCFDHPRTSDSPIEALAGRVGYPRGIVLGIRILIHVGHLKDYLAAIT